MTPEVRAAVAEALRDKDDVVRMDLHSDDDFLILHAAAGHDMILSQTAEAVAQAIDDNTRPDIHPTVRAVPAEWPAVYYPTAIQIRLNKQEALRLGGFAAAIKNITIAGQPFSLLDLVDATRSTPAVLDPCRST